MILATHAIIGAAVGRLFPKYPLVAFLAGFLSHFLTDAIPHWHYPLFSEKKDLNNRLNDQMVSGKGFIMDVVDIAIDCAAGFIFSILLFQSWSGFSHPDLSVLAGAIGGIFPDPLQFPYLKWRIRVLKPIQRFHKWFHAQIDIDKKHLLGISSQLLIVAAAVVISKLVI